MGVGWATGSCGPCRCHQQLLRRLKNTAKTMGTKLGHEFTSVTLVHRSPKLRINLLIRNTIISDKTNIREFVWEIIFRTICHLNIKKFQTFLLHLLVSCMSICLLVEYGVILFIIVIHRDLNNRSSPQYTQ